MVLFGFMYEKAFSFFGLLVLFSFSQDRLSFFLPRTIPLFLLPGPSLFFFSEDRPSLSSPRTVPLLFFRGPSLSFFSQDRPSFSSSRTVPLLFFFIYKKCQKSIDFKLVDALFIATCYFFTLFLF